MDQDLLGTVPLLLADKVPEDVPGRQRPDGKGKLPTLPLIVCFILLIMGGFWMVRHNGGKKTFPRGVPGKQETADGMTESNSTRPDTPACNSRESKQKNFLIRLMYREGETGYNQTNTFLVNKPLNV